MRVKSEFWVKAYLRSCQGHGVAAAVVRRGDESAGAIYICVDRLDRTVMLYGPAPAGLESGDTERRWVSCFTAGIVTEEEATSYLARQVKFDSDIWIVEIEDRTGRHFLGDAVVEE